MHAWDVPVLRARDSVCEAQIQFEAFESACRQLRGLRVGLNNVCGVNEAISCRSAYRTLGNGVARRFAAGWNLVTRGRKCTTYKLRTRARASGRVPSASVRTICRTDHLHPIPKLAHILVAAGFDQ